MCNKYGKLAKHYLSMKIWKSLHWKKKLGSTDLDICEINSAFIGNTWCMPGSNSLSLIIAEAKPKSWKNEHTDIHNSFTLDFALQ